MMNVEFLICLTFLLILNLLNRIIVNQELAKF